MKGYIGDDRNKLLKLKAELEIYKNFENSILNDLSFLVSFITLIVTMIYNASVGTESAIRTATAYSSFILVVLLAVLTVIQIFHKTISSRSKWRKYIAIVIEDIEKEK